VAGVIELERTDAPNWPGGVVTIWLARPEKRNAVTYAMWRDLGEVCRSLASDPTVRVVLLRGRGDHFCAGADIGDLHATRAEGEPSFAAANLAAEDALAALQVPTIAVLQGDVVGGGCALAIDCDLRIAASGARFGITPAKLGIVYPVPSIERVTRLLGPAHTKRLLFTGELIDVDEAQRIGLVDQVCHAEMLQARIDALVDTLCARSLLTQAATKQMVAAITANGSVGEELAATWATRVAAATDPAEGARAFAERRPANFTWRIE
jgi:enoyl-CoA hydratase/carnithine racemase